MDDTEGRDSDHRYATQEENVKEIRVRGAFDRHKFDDRGDHLSALATKKAKNHSFSVSVDENPSCGLDTRDSQ